METLSLSAYWVKIQEHCQISQRVKDHRKSSLTPNVCFSNVHKPSLTGWIPQAWLPRPTAFKSAFFSRFPENSQALKTCEAVHEFRGLYLNTWNSLEGLWKCKVLFGPTSRIFNSRSREGHESSRFSLVPRVTTVDLGTDNSQPKAGCLEVS